ncbi:ABC transporter permease [Streptomyces griseoviridis]|jgi:ABC-type dipeptide/oligopeptide/nickel transport system permease subunit|uniref:ABC-type dipeptide/oligopeptide/nickel transport system permease subunit n=3 Tax=Streptomyces TaxID=1883 RepID=A0ABT9LJM9_STRGD|nr:MULTISPECIES: ABC transporter permease [Streptomyces]MDP9683884.1 ABC-type dipeptide/oligopeptide/nickel transport system permease subunit [Streptomyces griseoviridis]GGS26261.1 peptide ABC transporter permease [Streptomyces niveoruber]GGS86032.1 peptide ABC transporter permease [Streptomyces griseoviridis]GGU40679.1 peptide ABC transporter permease [Streptomyces daghestanicus]GHI31163.1 peptide ABC transporter permease [Streptomyces daghestanicus]
MPELTTTSAEKTATAAPDGQSLPDPKPEKARSLWGDAWRDLRGNWIFIVSSLLILLLLVIAFFPGLFSSASPDAKDLAAHYLKKPEYGHVFGADWLGYDAQGRSVYARAIYGTRASLMVGGGTTLAVTVLGGLMGMLAGYFGGWIDAVLSRITDMFFGIPFLLGAMVMLNSFTERSIPIVILALTFLGWTQTARVMRGSVITVKSQDYVQAAKALGASTSRILFRHVLPNAIAPVIVVATISLGVYIGAEATLSYLGLGLDGASWGNDISDGQNQIRVAAYIMLYPSIMLSITVLAFIMLGEAVRNALDPKQR